MCLRSILVATITLVALSCPHACIAAASLQVWLTSPSETARFQLQSLRPEFGQLTSGPSITVDPERAFQTMDGFGFALTGGSARHLSDMTPPARAGLLQELFAHDSTNIRRQLSPCYC